MRLAIGILSILFATCTIFPVYAGAASGMLAINIQPRPLTIVLQPASASLSCGIAPGTLVSSASSTGGDGNPVSFSMAVPSGVTATDFAIDPNKGTIQIGANGIAPADCGKNLNITVTASQS